MPGFIKTKDCGRVIIAVAYRVKNNSDSKMYILGGHNHLSICDICKKMEDDEVDTLYDMWINDNMTNDFGYAEWKLYDAK
jgi:hypothetical protein